MKKNRKLVILSALLSSMMLISIGCSSGTDDGDNGGTVDIGIVLPTKDEPRWVQDEARFMEALDETEYSVEILFSQGSSAKEKENVESLLTKGIDVLIICPQDGDAAAASSIV